LRWTSSTPASSPAHDPPVLLVGQLCELRRPGHDAGVEVDELDAGEQPGPRSGVGDVEVEEVAAELVGHAGTEVVLEVGDGDGPAVGGEAAGGGGADARCAAGDEGPAHSEGPASRLA
jgi:hypothetical protein